MYKIILLFLFLIFSCNISYSDDFDYDMYNFKRDRLERNIRDNIDDMENARRMQENSINEDYYRRQEQNSYNELKENYEKLERLNKYGY